MHAPHVYVRAWALGCFHSHISARTASVDSCAEIKSCPLEEGAGKRCSECGPAYGRVSSGSDSVAQAVPHAQKAAVKQGQAAVYRDPAESNEGKKKDSDK